VAGDAVTILAVAPPVAKVATSARASWPARDDRHLTRSITLVKVMDVTQWYVACLPDRVSATSALSIDAARGMASTSERCRTW
jgi:hypothetical protein